MARKRGIVRTFLIRACGWMARVAGLQRHWRFSEHDYQYIRDMSFWVALSAMLHYRGMTFGEAIVFVDPQSEPSEP
jgi:hypothetical protein